MLGYASYQDIKTREIHDIVWIIPGTIGLILNIFELYTGSLSLRGAIISIGFMVILSGILWVLRLFGEADLIAFLALSIIHPRTPSFGFRGFTPILFSFTLIANSAIAGIFTAIYTIIVNLFEYLKDRSIFDRYNASFFKKMVIMFSGKYISIESLKGPPFEYPLEVNGELIIKPNLFDDEAANKAFMDLKENGIKSFWVSSTLPYIVVLFVGYLVSTFYGDVMFSIMTLLMSG
jgi:prepilin signal peptidase PulO-like enzyme (type II secretory pathway)